MSIFKFKVQSEREIEINKFNLLPMGDYFFEILKAELTTSKAGREMIKLSLAVKRDAFDSSYNLVYDYLMDGKFGWKIKALFKSIGQEEIYNLGEVDVNLLAGKTGHLKIGMREAANGYGPSNSVLDYIDGNAQSAASEPLLAVVEGEFDDEMPF